jgi:hypothetical protein
MSSLHVDNITLDAFNDALSRYPSTAPDKLRDLDAQRYDTIPAQVAARQDDKHLTKDKVETLVTWKLYHKSLPLTCPYFHANSHRRKHGTFRPSLLSLVQSNSSSTIESTTRNAFSSLSPSSPLPALKVLTQLRGIGPATASLLLSVAASDEVPFFSDELFRWCVGDWKRGIKYSVKEYASLVEKVAELRGRLEVRAVDVERVAWVLGKEGMRLIADEEAKEDKAVEKKGGEDKMVDDREEKTVKPAAKKRKADAKLPTEGTRKSTRTKK